MIEIKKAAIGSMLAVQCFIVMSSGTAGAQKPPALSQEQQLLQNRLKSEKVEIRFDNCDFQKSIALLSKTLHINLIADDIPKKTFFNLPFKGTIKEAIDKLADAFDYTWIVNRQGDIEMMRQYLEPAAFPQAHLREVRQTSTEMQNLFASLQLYQGRDAEGSDRVRAFYFSLSPDQIEYMKKGNPLYPSQLTLEQNKLYREAATCVLFGQMINSWNRFEFLLSSLSVGYLGYEQQKVGTRLFYSPETQYNWLNSVDLRYFDTHPDSSKDSKKDKKK